MADWQQITATDFNVGEMKSNILAITIKCVYKLAIFFLKKKNASLPHPENNDFFGFISVAHVALSSYLKATLAHFHLKEAVHKTFLSLASPSREFDSLAC